MTDLEELKAIIASTWRDEEMASAATYGIDAYAKLWPHVLAVNEWDVWNEDGKSLRHDVLDWLGQQGVTWDFYHLLDSWGLVGFKDLKTATHFKLRWSGMLKATSSPTRAWNPHPHNSSFAPNHEEVMQADRSRRRAVR
jgi:hypothetical protein